MVFEFYWTWYEDYSPILLEGPEKTEDEFAEDCKKAMKECFNDYLKKTATDEVWASLPDWIEFASHKLETYGYRIFRPVKFGYFGLYLPKEDDDFKEENDMPEFNEEIKKMKKYNSEFDKNMERE